MGFFLIILQIIILISPKKNPLKTKLTLLIVLIAFSLILKAQKGSSKPKKATSKVQKGSTENPKLITKTDSISYALGSLIGQDLKNGGFAELNYKVMNVAMQRALKGDSLLLNKEQSNKVLQAEAMAAMKKKAAENEN